MKRYLVLILLAFSCSNSNTPEFTCSMELDRLEVPPFNDVLVRYTGPEIDDLNIDVEGYPDLLVSMFWEDEDLILRSPLHPEGLEGGVLTLNVQINQQSCGKQHLTISPLEPNLEAGRQAVEDIKTLNQDLLTLFGTDAETARATLDPERQRIGGPAHQIAAALAGWYVDDPRSTLTLQGLDDESLGILGALAQTSGQAEQIRELAAYVEANPSTPITWQSTASGNQLFGIDLERSEISDGDELARRIALARPACKARDFTGKIWADIVSSLGPHAKNPGVLGQLAGFAVGHFFLHARAELVCASNPHEMLGGVAEPSYVRLEEDRDTPFQFSRVMYSAKAGKPANLAGLAVGLAYFAKTAASYGKAITGAEVGRKFNTVREFLREKASGALAEELENIEWGGWTFRGINLNHDRWTIIVSQNGTMVNGNCGNLCVRAAEVGQEVLLLVPREDFFMTSAVEVVVDGDVAPIRVQFYPTVRAVEPGELVDIEFQVSDAIDPGLEWRVEDGITAPFDTDVELGIFTYGAPVEEDLYPILIRAESTSKTGLRAPHRGPPPRRGHTILVIEELVVLPESECLSVGQSVTFIASASSHEGVPAVITWSPGIDDGVFRAEAPGEYELWVTATWPEREPITRHMNVQVGDCKCWFQTFGPAHENGKFEITGVSTYSEDLGGTVFMLNFPTGALLQWVSPEPEINSGYFPASWQAHLGSDGIWSSANGWNDYAFVEVDQDGEHFEIRYHGVVRATAPPFAAGAAFTSFDGDPGDGWYFIDYQHVRARALKFAGQSFSCQSELNYSNK